MPVNKLWRALSPIPDACLAFRFLSLMPYCFGCKAAARFSDTKSGTACAAPLFAFRLLKGSECLVIYNLSELRL